VESPRQAPIAPRETEFEKRRGVSHIEVRRGFAQVHVSKIPEPLMAGRLRALRAVADEQISIDFLKLTPTGLSFLVSHDRASAVQKALDSCGLHFTVRDGRSIVLVYAVNMRDEEGLISKIIQTVIGTGVTVDHVGDMHDRLLLVVEDAQAQKVADTFSETLMPEGARR
jgi:aspartokinase